MTKYDNFDLDVQNIKTTKSDEVQAAGTWWCPTDTCPPKTYDMTCKR
ncbi:hypothetical protein [Clostridium sp. JS66]|nr:hypothetical protein [Clostridium sp. JS66]WPC44134.1 hypothetical protein Q6H37_11845 [Clostridium sp. JS66]